MSSRRAVKMSHVSYVMQKYFWANNRKKVLTPASCEFLIVSINFVHDFMKFVEKMKNQKSHVRSAACFNPLFRSFFPQKCTSQNIEREEKPEN